LALLDAISIVAVERRFAHVAINDLTRYRTLLQGPGYDGTEAATLGTSLPPIAGRECTAETEGN